MLTWPERLQPEPRSWVRYSQCGDAIHAKISAFTTDKITTISTIKNGARGLSGFMGWRIGDDFEMRITRRWATQWGRRSQVVRSGLDRCRDWHGVDFPAGLHGHEAHSGL
jgi:hypothetical protein